MIKKIAVILFFIMLTTTCTFWGLTRSRIVSFVELAVNEDFTHLDYSDGYCFLASGPNGLRVIDVSNPAGVYEIDGFYNIDLDEIIYDVDIDGNTAVTISNKKLRILDITDPANIVELGNLDTVIGQDVEIEGDYVYSAANYWEGGLQTPDFIITNISNPSVPFEESRIESPQINDIQVSGDYVLLVDQVSLSTYDVSIKSSLVAFDNGFIPGGEMIIASGGYCYIFDSKTGDDNSADIHVLDISLLPDISVMGKYTVDRYTKTGDDPMDVVGDILLNTTPDAGLIVFDILKPSSPLIIENFLISPFFFGMGNGPLSVKSNGDYAFILGIEGFLTISLVDY
jgi:hypothetical protein